MGDMRNAYILWLENLKGRNQPEHPGVDGKIILKWILGKQGRRVWIGYIWLSGGLL
jgi:hypothetical protein